MARETTASPRFAESKATDPRTPQPATRRRSPGLAARWQWLCRHCRPRYALLCPSQPLPVPPSWATLPAAPAGSPGVLLGCAGCASACRGRSESRLGTMNEISRRLKGGRVRLSAQAGRWSGGAVAAADSGAKTRRARRRSALLSRRRWRSLGGSLRVGRLAVREPQAGSLAVPV